MFVETDKFDSLDEFFETVERVYNQQVISWSKSFNYLGSSVLSYELFSYLVECLVGKANKASGVVRSVCRSAVALPMSRAVSLHKSLVSPIALFRLHCVASFS